VVRGQGVRPKPVRRVAVRHLVEVGVGGPEAREELEAPGAIPAFFPQLALRRGERILTGDRAPARQLPRHRARQVAVLADEEDARVVHERQHAHGHADVEDGVDDFLAVGQPPDVLTKRDLAACVPRGGSQTRPPRGHRVGMVS